MKSVCFLGDKVQHCASVFHSELALYGDVLKRKEIEVPVGRGVLVVVCDANQMWIQAVDHTYWSTVRACV